ncbi:MAG: DMT(drug/metabolite transporter) superfamily permease, partial [Bacilli bacterium]|nr:DMT(drug/metabolite transporter) superfamily permease [Bacilli bacterium]
FYRRVPLPNRKDLKWYIVCGMLQTTYFNIAIQISLNYISAGITSVLTYSMPFWLALLAHFWIPAEKLTARKLLGVVAGILGLSFAMDVRLNGSVWALFLAVSSGITWAISNVIIKRKLTHVDNVQFTTWQMAAGAAGLFLYSALFEHGPTHWGVMPLVYILFTGIVGSSFAFVLWFHILSKTEASKASISLLLVPVIGVISGCLVLHESLKLMTTIGIILVLAGIWIVNSKPRSQKLAVYTEKFQ